MNAIALLIEVTGTIVGRIMGGVPNPHPQPDRAYVPVIGELSAKTTPADFARFAEVAREWRNRQAYK